ncbi:MAG: hypothetical protein RLN60_01420 [Phycisphaerales bacterium]
MADALAKVRPGQPLRIPAAAYNAFVDAAKSSRGVRQDSARDAVREQTSALTPVKNTSGATIPRFGVMGIDAPLFDPGDAPDGFKRHLALTGTTPTELDHLGKFVIALEPIPAGAIGMACGAGLCAAQVEFPAPPPGGEAPEPRFADVADGSTSNLKAGDQGAATILWREPGEGVRWAIVRLGGFGVEPALFPVALTLAGGQQGSALIEASWTYDVADVVTDEPLAAGVDPTSSPHHWTRPETGPVSPATFGLARRNDEDEIELTWINETTEHMWVFPITLSQTGGEQGTPSMPATWRYAVTDATSGLTLVTNVDPTADPHQWRRPVVGKVEPATHGYASLSSVGLLVIGWINEVPEIHPMPAFPVLLVLAELASGGAETPTNHMYHVFDVASGEQLGEFVNPGQAPHQWKRPDIGRYAPATFGMAYRNASDDVIITWTNEVPELEACAATSGGGQ